MPRTSASQKPRVLIIERDIEVQRRIAHSLEGVYTVDLTSSGSLAMLLMKDYRYACVVASYELPNRHNGAGILQALRGMPGGRYVPIIATGSEIPYDRMHEILSEGFSAWLNIPGDVERLEPVISGVLETWD